MGKRMFAGQKVHALVFDTEENADVGKRVAESSCDRGEILRVAGGQPLGQNPAWA